MTNASIFAYSISRIQIQHLLKLNLIVLFMLVVNLHSNTTLVKVKSLADAPTTATLLYSNTTLVKVKFRFLSVAPTTNCDSNTTLVKVKLDNCVEPDFRDAFKYNTC